MKTDKFGESIREKLEGVDPPFREKDWLQLRSFLRRHGVPSIGGGLQWLMPAVSAATVAGLVITSVWQYRTNQELSRKVDTLRDTVAILQRELPAEIRPDTVYIVQEVPAAGATPSADLPSLPLEDRRVQPRTQLPPTDGAAERFADQTNRYPETQADRRNSQPSGPAEPLRPVTEPERGLAANAPNQNTGSSGADRNGTVREPLRSESDRPTYPGSGRTPNQLDPNRPNGADPGFNHSGSLVEDARDARPDLYGGNAAPSENRTALVVEPLAGRPLSFDSSYFVETYRRQSRSIRPSASALGSSSAPAVQPVVEEPSRLVRFRLGPSTELGLGQWNIGLAGEVLVGEHLVLGVGLNRLKISGDQFLTDIQFNVRTKMDFRHKYGNVVPVDPRFEIMDINRRAASWQLPLTLGYRLPMGNRLYIIPAVGASLSLQPREYIGFTHRVGPYDFKQKEFYSDSDKKYYNSWQWSIGIEKALSHWAFQASPYIWTPFRTRPNSLNQMSAGVRLKVMYQF
ncbi:hypothetical protein [Larkinella soli]|uniref:hypothetical protein n=1 Tax=Larkinella soli TaxID=1770527 RepID=UPI000FFBAB1F|nr:hypothetical protein [Larkinella soli]